jgi:hypothetical protein
MTEFSRVQAILANWLKKKSIIFLDFASNSIFCAMPLKFWKFVLLRWISGVIEKIGRTRVAGVA